MWSYEGFVHIQRLFVECTIYEKMLSYLKIKENLLLMTSLSFQIMGHNGEVETCILNLH